ncbi:MAG: pyruvate ferredoxin oxidoreductase, partial [Deltaproteobacteria bacterium]|nr:pyruvate ferredoxin oxidoreductase [Deltaproteobacteria bacterium]
SRPELAQRTQGIVLLGVFLRVAPFMLKRRLGAAELYGAVEKSLRKFFGKLSEQVIQDNLKAVKRGHTEVLEVPPEVMEAAA